MKKMITLLVVLSFFVSFGLLFMLVKSFTSGINWSNSSWIVNGKYFLEPADLRSWITPNEFAIKKEAEQFRSTDPLETITKTYNWLENGYHYEEDALIVYNKDHIILKGGPDSWNSPLFTLAMKHQNNGEIWVDCEDGTFLLVSLLRANGIDAWANIGTIDLNGTIYGHAWATVNLDGKEYLLETTLGEPLQKLQPVPNFYHMKFKFNEKDVITTIGADINEVYPPLPPQRITDLKKVLNAEGNN